MQPHQTTKPDPMNGYTPPVDGNTPPMDRYALPVSICTPHQGHMHPQQTTKPDPMNGYTSPVGAYAPPTSHETRPNERIYTPRGRIDRPEPLPRRVLTNLRVYAAAGDLLAKRRRVSEVRRGRPATNPPAKKKNANGRRGATIWPIRRDHRIGRTGQHRSTPLHPLGYSKREPTAAGLSGT